MAVMLEANRYIGTQRRKFYVCTSSINESQLEEILIHIKILMIIPLRTLMTDIRCQQKYKGKQSMGFQVAIMD